MRSSNSSKTLIGSIAIWSRAQTQIQRYDPCEICLCIDGEIFCWWKQCGEYPYREQIVVRIDSKEQDNLLLLNCTNKVTDQRVSDAERGAIVF